MEDILARLANSSSNESSHELQCRCFDASEEISKLRQQRKDLELARGALADIANSDDMTITVARKKAKRIYIETRPSGESSGTK